MNEPETKRRHDRIEAPTISLQIASGERSRRRFLRDLSHGGVYIRTHDVQPVGSEVKLELTPPEWDEPIRLLGEVVRVAEADEDGESVPVGMGIQFKNVGPKNRELLAELLSEYESASPQLAGGELPDDVELLKREVRALRTRLREARAMLTSLHDEVETLEDDDDSNRAIIERLAMDKQKLETSLDERKETLQRQLQDKHARELRTILDGYEKRRKRAEEKYVDRIADLEEQNTALTRELAKMTDRTTHAESELREQEKLLEEATKKAKEETQGALAEERARAEELADRLQLTEERLSKIRKKERELRRLVSVMSGETDDGDEQDD